MTLFLLPIMFKTVAVRYRSYKGLTQKTDAEKKQVEIVRYRSYKGLTPLSFV